MNLYISSISKVKLDYLLIATALNSTITYIQGDCT